MRDFSTKSEVKEKDQKLKDETQESRDQAREHTDKVKMAADALVKGEKPFLRETVDKINEIQDSFRGEAEENAGKEQTKVEEKVGTEKSEVSEPLREGEAQERQSAEKVDAAGRDTGEYRGSIDGTKDTLIDVADFLKEVGDDSEHHQEESRRDADEITQAARAAVASMKRF